MNIGNGMGYGYPMAFMSRHTDYADCTVDMAYVLVTTTKKNKTQISSASITSITNAAMPDVCRSVLMRESGFVGFVSGMSWNRILVGDGSKKSLMCAPANKAVGSHFT